jgi:hypothetical protein
MNRTLWKWLLAVSLSLNVGMITSATWNTVRSTPPSGSVDLPDYLKLTEQQRQRWRQGEEAFLKDLSSNWREIRAHRESLVRQVFSANPDRAAIDKEQGRIAALQDAQQRRVIDQLLAERDMLDASQRAALMRLLLDRYSQESTEEELLHRE